VAGFEIAGADGRHVTADARIEGTTVLVSSPLVAAPRSVRYGWADNPAVSLYNAAGLPASPFRSTE
jgi:sialate O-acetylesterase